MKKKQKICFDFEKRHIKGEKQIAQTDFAEYLKKQLREQQNLLWPISRNWLNKTYCYISKVQDLEKSASKSFFIER